jgi:beta-glucosidase
LTAVDDASALLPSQSALQFPTSFVWGTATAAYQVEGAVAEDGRTPSIWDVFSHTPGKVARGDTGDVAADHYHRYREDVALMRQLGVGAYRFSVAWPRIVPGGVGPVNQAGVDFYSRLVDELLESSIAPAITLYHWDLPAELPGGWTSRDTAYRFAEYAVKVVEALGDRVSTWITLNEPWCSAFLGYADGEHAPGNHNPAEALQATHHLLLAHGLAVAELRRVLPSTANVAVTLNPSVVRAASTSLEDRLAAHKIDGLQTRIFADPIVRGAYPRDVVDFTSSVSDWSFVRDGDLATISAPIDFFGLNFYNPGVVGAIPPGEPTETRRLWPGCDDVRFVEMPVERTSMNWPVDETGLYELLMRFHRDYGLPRMVTENGAAYDDTVDARGGYDKRFGIVRVDFETQQRTVKDSGWFYRDVVRSNAVPTH